MRTYGNGRFPGDNREMDVQSLIDEQPATCSISRRSGSSLLGTRTVTSVGSFECRVDILKITPRLVEEPDKYGLEAKTGFRLIAMPATDRNGNTVDIQHTDTAVISGETYRVLYVNRTRFMTEATLERFE